MHQQSLSAESKCEMINQASESTNVFRYQFYWVENTFGLAHINLG